MTRFIHDKFAKDYLEQLLQQYGKVTASAKVAGEIKEVDILFNPSTPQNLNLDILGVLGRFTEFPALIEPFRNPVSDDEICDCLEKLLRIRGGLRREAKRNNAPIQDSKIPKLWILTPTISESKLSKLNVSIKEEWLTGIYFLGDILRTAIVEIHQLPKVPETLWLRLLGRGTVQQQAIEEINLLSSNHPFQKATLELIYNLRENLKINQNLEEDDRELIMRLEPLYQQDREQAKQEGRQEGRQEGERLVVENLLKVRFSLLDEELQAIIEPILALTPEEFTPLLIQLSREELIQRFSNVNI
jgi:hypothetical protein